MNCHCGANPGGLCGDCWLSPEQLELPFEQEGG